MNFLENVNPMAFVDNLRYMGLGMLGILAVMGVIIGSSYLLGAIFSKSKEEEKTDK